MRSRPLCLLAAAAVAAALHAGEEKPAGPPRILWTASRVVGSPDPPSPYVVEKAFTGIRWKSPIYVTAEPGTDSLLVVEQGGEKEKPSRVLRVRDDPGADRADPFLELNGWMVYSVAFHPDYPANGQVFAFAHGPTGAPKLLNRILRFTATGEPRRCDPKSEEPIIEWRSEGHDGGDLVFGLDRMLYLSTGDGTSDSDAWVTGQDLSDLLGGVLRIDVDHPAEGQRYAVPPDNPFLGLKDARPEIWAYGLRNPWRMCIDRKTGAIWAGQNGQDLWETAHLIRRGENYGWSVYEGSHPFYLQRRLGPTPPVAPTIEHHHCDFRSLTGGVVYRGSRLPELEGAYVYGDYSTGKIWGALHDGARIVWHRELCDTTLQIAAFGVDQRGDLLIADHGSGLFRLVPRPEGPARPPFPVRLSETGLFLSVKDHRVHPGLIPYAVNAPGWADGAVAERFIALPGEGRIDYSSGTWGCPEGTVLVETLSLEGEPGRRETSRRIETRLLTRQEGEWTGYSYRWNEGETEAELAPREGGEVEVALADSRAPEGIRRAKWRLPSRADCMACHSRAANFVLGLTEPQMNRECADAGVRENQLSSLERLGVFKGKLPKPPAELSRLADPYDPAQDLEARARSYLHVNCSVCHVEAGGGNSKMELGHGTQRDRMNLFSARPQHDTFGIADAMLVAPGDPDRSILCYRIGRRGRAQMPPLGSSVVDERAAALIYDWIKAMKPERRFVKDWKMEDLLPKLGEVEKGRSFESGKAAFRDTGCIQCHRLAGEGGSVGPVLEGAGRRLGPRELLESLMLPSKVIAPEYATTEAELSSGETVLGRVVGEDERSIVIRPIASPEKSISLARTSVRRRMLLPVSNMPEGILDSLEEAQILDLLAYLLGDGRSDQPAFR